MEADKDHLISEDSDAAYKKYPGVNNVAYVVSDSAALKHLLSLFISCNRSLSDPPHGNVLLISVGPRPGPRISSEEPFPHRRRLPRSCFLSSRPCPSPTPLHASTALHWGGAATDALPAGRCLCPRVAHLSEQHNRDHSTGGQQSPPGLRPSGPQPQSVGPLLPTSGPFPICKYPTIIRCFWQSKNCLVNITSHSFHACPWKFLQVESWQEIKQLWLILCVKSPNTHILNMFPFIHNRMPIESS